jgi:hypothetical protein
VTKSDDTASRDARLAKALRANLARRKAQARARRAAERAAPEAGERPSDAEKPQVDDA